MRRLHARPNGLAEEPTITTQNQYLAKNSHEIHQAAAHIRAGGVVAFPTETVYGLGANALDPKAVAKVFAIKNRPRFDPLIVHLAEADAIHPLVTNLPKTARTLMDQYWPGPLTLVLPKSKRIPDIVTAGLPTVALRVPDHPIAGELIRRAGVPVAAPSANPFGCVSPTCAGHVRDQLGHQVNTILDGGSCRIGLESTIIAFDGDDIVLLRSGGVSIEDMASDTNIEIHCAKDHDDRPQSPGRLLRHYAPKSPFVLRPEAGPPLSAKRSGLLTLQPTPWDSQYTQVEVLSLTGSLPEAAAALFAAIRRLDQQNLKQIEAVAVPEKGLGRAINDRLRRASYPAAESPPN